MKRKIIVIFMMGLMLLSGFVNINNSNFSSAKSLTINSQNDELDIDKYNFGYIPLPDDYDPPEEPLSGDSYGLPPSFDWRNVDGKDYTTSVKDQEDCGSCWAFAAMASLESVIKIEKQNPSHYIDLSEQYLVSCCPPINNVPNDCSGGNALLALQWLSDMGGALKESCFPYQASNKPCDDKCSTWQNYLVPIESPTTPGSGIDNIKRNLLKRGPLVTVMAVYDEDFIENYDGGVYINTKYNN